MPSVKNDYYSIRRYVGIDPGASGGIVLIDTDLDTGKSIPTLWSMPRTEKDTWEIIRALNVHCAMTTAVIEMVSGYIGERQPGSAMFKFGQSYGSLRMALIAARIPFEAITPQTWQKGVGIPKRKKTETKSKWKNRLKAMAQQLYPEGDITLATSDALLIAEYCRRKMLGII